MTTPLRLLLVEDSIDDAELILRELRSADYEVEAKRVQAAEDLRMALDHEEWDLVISDYSMPRFNGLVALDVVRKHDPQLPFILVSGAIGEEVAVEVMRAGAYDYILKDRLARLAPAVKRELQAAEARRAGRLAEEALRRSEGLYRSLFENILEGFAYCRILNESGRGKDFVYLEVNEAFERLTGLKNVVGRKVSDLIPGIQHTNPEVFETYVRVALTGKPERFETYLNALKAWFSISVHSPAKDHFVALFEDITERMRAERALRTSLEEKTTLLKEVHHRVKNNLQIVTSLLNLQAAGLKHPEACGVLRETQGRIRSMALLHETLYRTGNMARVSFDVYLNRLCTRLAHSFGAVTERVKIETHAPPVELDLDHAAPCGLIVNELVSNACKHAFPGERAGRISVEMKVTEMGSFALCVADDDIGLPPGLDPNHADTLGFCLVAGLARQIGATVDIQGACGTAIRIEFSAGHAPGDQP